MPSHFLKALPFLFVMGCGASSSRQIEFSGTVSFQGQPLPGGAITFLSEQGLQNSALIDPDGHYQIKMFVGPSKVTVNNLMLRKDQDQSSRLKRPGENANTSPMAKGTYVLLPTKYQSVNSSGLTCDVREGMETCDFNLE